MKLKVVLISPNRLEPVKLKESLPGFYVNQAKNILEFYQLQGGKPTDAFLFLEAPKFADEFSSIHSFIRSKPIYAKSPMGIFCNTQVIISSPVSDPLVRSYLTPSGLFLAIIEFLSNAQNPKSMDNFLSFNKIEGEFLKALGTKLGQNIQFKARPATSDESHSSFFCQQNEEISTNLSWFKLSARILENGSAGLKTLYQGLSDKEIQEISEKILSMVLKDFRADFDSILNLAGALRFVNSDRIKPADKASFLKNAKSEVVIFESTVCSILLEVIRYI